MSFPKFLRVALREKFVTVKLNETSAVLKRIIDPVDSKFTELLASSLGFSYELLTPSDGSIGAPLPDGNWTGMMGMVLRNEADVIISIISVTEKRSEALPFTYPFDIVGVTFATRKPEYSPDRTTFLKPFSYQVWISVLACLIIIPFILSALLKEKCNLQKLFFYAYSIILRQSLKLPLQKVRDYILIIFWVLGTSFLSYSYSAVLLSFLTFPPLIGVRTIPELSAGVANGKYQCTTYPGTFFIAALVYSSDPAVRIIGRSVLENKGSNNIESVLQNTKGYKKPVFIGGRPHFLPLEGRYFISEDTFFYALPAVAVRKDFCCIAKFNKIIGYIWAAGLYKKILTDDGFLDSLSRKFSSTEVQSSERKLTLEDLEGPFIFILAGYVLSLLVFVSELIVDYLERKNILLCSKQISFGTKIFG